MSTTIIPPCVIIAVLLTFRGHSALIGDYDGETFRAAYTVEFARAVYVLHVFQKKSKHGVATPRRDIELVRARLRRARDAYRGGAQRPGQE